MFRWTVELILKGTTGTDFPVPKKPARGTCACHFTWGMTAEDVDFVVATLVDALATGMD